MRTLRLVSASILLVACGRFAPDRNLRRHASPDEVVGTWRLLPSSLAMLKLDAHYSALGAARPHEIVFRRDGTCHFRSVDEASFEHAEYVDAECTWQLVHDPPFKQGKPNEVEIKIGRVAMTLNLAEVKHRLHLWQFWGDPDTWEFLEYEKT